MNRRRARHYIGPYPRLRLPWQCLNFLRWRMGKAVAHTTIVGRQFSILIRSGLSDEEVSISLYHEVLEAASVAVSVAPAAVAMFNEDDFERAAYEAHQRFGEASPENLDRILQSHGFSEQ